MYAAQGDADRLGHHQPRREEAQAKDADEQHPDQAALDGLKQGRAGGHDHGDGAGEGDAETHVVVDAQHIVAQTDVDAGRLGLCAGHVAAIGTLSHCTLVPPLPGCPVESLTRVAWLRSRALTTYIVAATGGFKRFAQASCENSRQPPGRRARRGAVRPGA
jgi:hypothetical protein